MPFDHATLHALEYQGRRMRAALHPGPGEIPDRQKARLIQDRVDGILDRRPRPIAVTDDGEILWEGTSPFVLGQASESIALNATGQAEVVMLPHSLFSMFERPDDDEPGGGLGLLDRP